MKIIIFLILFLSIHCCFIEIHARNSKSANDLIPSKCANGVSKTRAAYEADIASWKTCRWQRSDVINMTGLGFDLDGDQRISAYEIEFARHYYFTPMELVFGESTKEVMEHCDCDGDGFIDQDDFFNSDMSCIRNCAKGTEVWWFIGSRIGDKPYSGVHQPDPKDRPEALDHLYK